MFKGKIRQFYWFMIIAGAIVVYSTVGKNIKARWSAVLAAAQGNPPQVANSTDPIKQPEVQPTATNEPVVVSPSGKTMTFKGKTFVQIDNRWLEKREDNTYKVNGVTTYFIDDRAPTAEETDKVLNADVENTEDISILERIASGQLSSYSPAEVAMAVQKIKKARSQIKERDAFLEELGRADK